MKTVNEIVGRMDAIIAGADARPEDEHSLTDAETTEYEALEAELAVANKNVQLRSRHGAYHMPVGDDGVLHATPKGDEVAERAFESYLRTGQKNMDLVEVRAQGEATPAAGGYLVPDGFRNKIVERLKAFGGLINEAEQLNTESGNNIRWVSNDDTANQGEIVAESAAPVGGADLVFGHNDLSAYKYDAVGANGLPLRVPVELLQDSAFDLPSLLSRKLAQRIHRKQAVDAVSGNGANKPLGINYTLPDQILATANPLTYVKLNALVHGVDPAYRELGNCKFLMNDTTLAAIEQIVDANGRPLIKDSTDSIGTAPSGQKMLGYPIVIDQAMPSIANSTPVANDGFLIFGDLREAYVWRSVRDIVMLVDPYGRALNGEVQYFAWSRGDGTIQDRNAYAVLAGYHA